MPAIPNDNGPSPHRWIFLRAIARNDQRARGYFELNEGNLVRIPYEVVHAPSFAIYATDAMQRRLHRMLNVRRRPDRSILFSKGIAFGSDGVGRPYDRWIDTLPPQLQRQLLKAKPSSIAESGEFRRVVLLCQDNKLIGVSAFGPFFNMYMREARGIQPAPVRLAMLVGLIATAFEDPERLWYTDAAQGEKPYSRLISHAAELRAHHSEPKIRLAETVIRLAMLAALPNVLDSLPADPGPGVEREACRRLAETVVEELYPFRGDDDWEGSPVTDGYHEVLTRTLLAWPGSDRELLLDRAGEPGQHPTLHRLHAVVRARFTPDQMCAVMMPWWGIPPMDSAEAKRLKIHRHRAHVRLAASGV
jgi:hypothetical protein